MERVEFSKRVRAEAFARCGGNCEKCGMRLKVGEVEFDHVIPFFMTQDSSLQNAQCLCRPCHRGVGAKTADDQRDIAKVKRMQAKHEGTFPPSKFRLRSQGFQKSRNV